MSQDVIDPRKETRRREREFSSVRVGVFALVLVAHLLMFACLLRPTAQGTDVFNQGESTDALQVQLYRAVSRERPKPQRVAARHTTSASVRVAAPRALPTQIQADSRTMQMAAAHGEPASDPTTALPDYIEGSTRHTQVDAQFSRQNVHLPGGGSFAPPASRFQMVDPRRQGFANRLVRFVAV